MIQFPVMAAKYNPVGTYSRRNLRSGACLMCGASDNTAGREGIVTLGKHRNYVVQICNVCAENVGETMKMVTETKVQELRNNNRRLGSALKAANDRIEALSATVTAFLSAEPAEVA